MMRETPVGSWEVLATGLDVVFCGLNPSATSAASGYAFSHASNRFWRVVHLAGFTDRLLAPEEQRLLLDYGCGITAAVARPTRGAAEVPDAEYRSAAPGFERRMLRLRPKVVAFLGKRALTAMRGGGGIDWGRQPERFAGAVAWVLPNPSGLNRAFGIEALVTAYAELAVARSTGV